MDYEKHLISKVIVSKDITEVAEAGLSEKFFLAPENKRVFSGILKHKREHGNVPSLAALKADYPTYKFVKPEEEFSYLIEQVQRRYKLSLLETSVSAAVDAIDQEGDPKKTQQILAQVLRQVEIDVPSTRDTDLTQTGDERLDRYWAYKDMDGGLRGIPTGFGTIDRATLGLQKQQLVTFVGPPKAGKSTLLLLCTAAAHQWGAKPLFIGFEMSNDEQEERFDAFSAGISHSRLRSGTLREDEWEKLEKKMRTLESMQPLILSSDSTSMTTLTGVAAKIETIKPDIVFIDGIYMMDDEEGEAKNSPQALTNLTRGFKKMAQRMDIPIVITTQVLEWKMSKKKGITSDSIGYSSSFAQDSDTILGVMPIEDEDDLQKLSVVLSRNSPKVSTFVRWDWETGTFEELDENPYEEDENGSDGSSW